MSEEQSIRVIAFSSGKQDDWHEWELKVVAKALANGYYSTLDGTTSVPAASVALDATTVPSARLHQRQSCKVTQLGTECSNGVVGRV